jgi:steroid delta-isomerase-like uncharacterized protein
MTDAGSHVDRSFRMPHLSRRVGLKLAGLGVMLPLVGGAATRAAAHDATPMASPGAECIDESAANGATAARWFTEALNQGKLDLLGEILDPNVVLDPAAFPAVDGVAQVQQTLGELLTAFPDVSYEIQDTLAENDRVVIRWTATGTQAVDYAGIAATGEAQRWSGIHFFHFACGKITNIWAEADILAQLGLVDDVHATPVPFAGETGSPGPACELSSRDEMERIASIWQGVWTSHDLADYDGVVTPDEVHHFGVRSDTVGLDALEHSLEGFFTAFPDLQAPIEDIVVDGDRVAFRYTDSGTNTGDFFGNPPTGNPVAWTGINILRIQCGMVVESWAEVDGLGLWRQLGLLETPATPAPA